MTEQEREALKRQLKDEILAEMDGKHQHRKMKTVWDEIKPEIEERFAHLDGPSLYQLTAAFSTIIRHSLGIRQIRYIPFSHEEVVKVFADTLLTAMKSLGEPEEDTTQEDAS